MASSKRWPRSVGLGSDAVRGWGRLNEGFGQKNGDFVYLDMPNIANLLEFVCLLNNTIEKGMYCFSYLAILSNYVDNAPMTIQIDVILRFLGSGLTFFQKTVKFIDMGIPYILYYIL